MPLKLYNTLTRRKEDFVPLDPKYVRMYVCGPTVYDFAHVGNARPVIVFDVLFRLLRHIYGENHVTYVRNITDVDDKINDRALRDHPDLPLNEAIRRVTEQTTNQFHEDVKALGCLEPTEEPRATDNIPQMIEMIVTLLQRGHAYQAGGEVLFDVASMADYGALSNRNLDEQQAGARVAVEAHKRNPADFVLWKLSSDDEPGWESPWGRGRPGWHIECSAMSKRYLGEVFDIHGGGIDLIFPHHENELAQTRCAFGTKLMANIWMHNGFLKAEGQKMSKSLGNFVTINELVATEKFGGRAWPGPVLRLAMLRTHYRQPIDWTADSLHQASETLDRWRAYSGERTTKNFDKDAMNHFLSFLYDDLNTAGAFSAIDEIVAANLPAPSHRAFVFYAMRLLGFKSPFTKAKQAAEALDRANRILLNMPMEEIQRINNTAFERPTYKNGVLRPETRVILALELLDKLSKSRELTDRLRDPLLSNKYKNSISRIQTEDDENRARIKKLLDARLSARKAKNWTESDRIRDELAAMGIAIKDNKDGTTTWEVKR